MGTKGPWIIGIIIAIVAVVLLLKGPELACRFKGEDWIAKSWRSGDCISLPDY